MNKKVKIILIVTLIVAIVIINYEGSSKLPQINSEEDLTKLLDKVYENLSTEIYNVETISIDISDENAVESYTGLLDGNDLEFAIASEPQINTQAYSLVLAKVKDGVNANNIAEKMSEGVNTRKWICVAADKLYATSSRDIVFLIMTNEEMAKSVYENFKKIAGTIGAEYEKAAEEEELPPDTVGNPIRVPDTQ